MLRKSKTFLILSAVLFSVLIPHRLKAVHSSFNDIFLFIWKSDQTQTGAGHASFAIGRSMDSLYYFTHYRKKDGGGRFVTGNYSFIRNYDRKIIKTENHNAALVIRIKTSPESDRKLIRVAKRQIKKDWRLFSGNCADGCIRILRNSRIRTGKSAIINTPNNLVKSLANMNKKLFQKDVITVLEGDINDFIKQDRNNVAEVIRRQVTTFFGLIKSRNNSLLVISDTLDDLYDSLMYNNQLTR